MVIQYPDNLKYKSVSADSVYDQETGKWTKPVAGVSFENECRAEPNGEGKTIPSNDGHELKYSFIIYMPKTAAVFRYGQNVEVYSKENRLIFSGKVQAFSLGQFNARLWV